MIENLGNIKGAIKSDDSYAEALESTIRQMIPASEGKATTRDLRFISNSKAYSTFSDSSFTMSVTLLEISMMDKVLSSLAREIRFIFLRIRISH